MTEQEIVTNHCPLSVNVKNLSAYLLDIDEVVLFDWFTIKQSLVFGYKPFYYSLERIEQETRLKRRRIEKVINRFSELGFLSVDVHAKTDGPGRVRYFQIDFSQVVCNLPRIIDQENKTAGDFLKYFKALAKVQNRTRKEKETKREREAQEGAERLYNSLNEVYWRRIDMYNNGELTSKKPDRCLDKTQLAKDKNVLRRLVKLSDEYDDETIRRAFTVACDDYLRNRDELKRNTNLIKWFLYYKQGYGIFPKVNECISIYQSTYSYKR